ncbi:MAG: HlyD family efflux transporter periplasmic adaptor subunit [Cellvibrio sp.]|nr:HlyD family efflux transporter periplasmic adaptor subunit [Cellvibrio sp.]
MDRPLTVKKSNFIKYGPALLLVAILVGSVIYFLNSNIALKTLSRSQIRTAVVKQGSFSVEAHGTGVLIPKGVEWITPMTSGEVRSVNVRAGDEVKKGQVLFHLSSTELYNSLMEAQARLSEYKAALLTKEFDLMVQEMDYESSRLDAQLEVDYILELFEAQHRLVNNKNSPVSLVVYNQTKIRLKQLQGKSALAEEKIVSFKNIKRAQLAELQLRIDSAEQEYKRVESLYSSLEFRAQKSGIIQDFDLKIGQLVSKGESVAKIVNPREVYARLKVPAYQANNIVHGLPSTLKINRKLVQGTVERVDPNVKGSTIEVDIAIEGNAGDARIGMQASGIILISAIEDALYVERPDNAVSQAEIGVYKVYMNEEKARLSFISTGELSTNYMQIVNGLKENDEIIVSDIGDVKASQDIIITD